MSTAVSRPSKLQKEETGMDHLKISPTLWDGMKRVGLARNEVIARAQLPLRTLQEDTPVSTKQFFALWHAMEELSPDPTVGLWIATELRVGQMPPSFMVAYHARDYRDALQRVARFKRLCAPEEILFQEDKDSGEIQLHWNHAKSTELPHSLVDASLASLLELGRHGTGAHIRPLAVSFSREPQDERVYERYFECDVRFNAAHNGMTIRKSDLEMPFLNYNTELLQILDQALTSRLEQHASKASLSEQIQWILRRRLTAGRPDIRSVASELAMSERSLQRRLTSEGVSFQGLLSRTRHQLALEYLSDTNLSIIEVAYMLGYEDQNSFFRAFRLWETRTPSDWRTENRVTQ